MGDFLHTGATSNADINLIVQLAMGAALLTGMMLARRKHYRAHKYCQSSVLLLNLVLIGSIMVPSFRAQVDPQLPSGLNMSFYAVATGHAVLGVIAEILGLYVILVAGTTLIPEGFRFKSFKPWMRTTLALWWVVVLFGVGVYYVWYLGPAAKVSARAGVHGHHAVVLLSNFHFSPKTETVPAGTTVEWIDTQGMHTVTSDTGAFHSPVLITGRRFRHTFKSLGAFPYHCEFHGGIGMVGRIVVKAHGPK